MTALEWFRRDTGILKDVSFDTIAGGGRDARDPALPRIDPVEPGDRARPGLLIDSGGQYSDGTTDVTRTVIVGEPSARCATASPGC